MQPRLEQRTKQATQSDPWDSDNLESLKHFVFYNFVEELNAVFGWQLTTWRLKFMQIPKTYVAYHSSFEKGQMSECVIEGLVSRFMLPVSHGSIVLKNS